MSSFSAPRAIAADDHFVAFDCGQLSLDEWLCSRAITNEATGASRTFVTVDQESGDVAGYYCLSAGSLALEDAAGRVKRNMPSPMPIILIGRLAVDRRFAGRGLGASLLQDAVLKGLEASRIIGACAFLVDALDDSAESFYRKFGFELMPPASKRAMYLLVADAEATVAAL
ncbi:GNAT family N-acetyltransferase [Schumannella luteola]|uniref:GNAT superfamily N-acetyltransferase n=1 Tax=Schumannella luteola TaxID=472059 RepID=A0A852Y7D8_9MICO|nr:GNAT superfamily N-acetyltransferase [Schumannella luteola]TPX01949.1 GNAT family N-acetyltransferase [Schumannella luteola]